MEQQETESDAESVLDENVFYFESDHLALRGNRDYTNMLRTIAILEAQRMRVHQQMEELALAKKRYMDDPELFLKKIQSGEPIVAAEHLTIATVFISKNIFIYNCQQFVIFSYQKLENMMTCRKKM